MAREGKVTYPSVVVSEAIFTENGMPANVFGIIGGVAKEIKKELDSAKSSKFTTDCMNMDSYDKVVAFARKTVVVI